MKFLTDAQARADFVALLRKLEYDVETVQQHGLEMEPDDARLVAEARSRDRILLSFDNFRGETGWRVALEFHDRGGKVIQFAGGPQQLPERALGRFLFHLPEWQPFLERNDGLVYLSDLRGNCAMHPREQIHEILRKSDRQPFQDYIAARAQARAAPRARRRRSPPPEQSTLEMTDGA